MLIKFTISDMIEWVEEASRLVQERYLCKKYLVESFNPELTNFADTFIKQWSEGDTDLVQKLEGRVQI